MNDTFQEYPKWVGDVIVQSREEEAAIVADKEKAPAQPATKKSTKRIREAKQ